MISYDYEKYFESIKAYSYLAAVADLPVSGEIQGWELFTNLSGQIFHRVSTLQEVGPATRKRWRKRPRFNKCKACIMPLGDSGAGLKPGGSGFISSSFHHLGWTKMFQEKAALLPGWYTFSIMMHQHSEQVWMLTQASAAAVFCFVFCFFLLLSADQLICPVRTVKTVVRLSVSQYCWEISPKQLRTQCADKCYSIGK